jgi:hypothetical protein
MLNLKRVFSPALDIRLTDRNYFSKIIGLNKLLPATTDTIKINICTKPANNYFETETATIKTLQMDTYLCLRYVASRPASSSACREGDAGSGDRRRRWNARPTCCPTRPTWNGGAGWCDPMRLADPGWIPCPGHFCAAGGGSWPTGRHRRPRHRPQPPSPTVGAATDWSIEGRCPPILFGTSASWLER